MSLQKDTFLDIGIHPDEWASFDKKIEYSDSKKIEYTEELELYSILLPGLK